jgi:hypothetical protein
MDKFLTQRFANAYPRWTKARREPSSVTQAFYSPIASVMANEYATLVKQSEDFSLHRHWIPWTVLSVVQLEEADYYPYEFTTSGYTVLEYPTVSSPALALDFVRVENPTDLFCQLPTAFASYSVTPVSDWLIYDSNTGTIAAIDSCQRLIVTVSQSTEYYLSGLGEFSSGKYFVDVAGKDISGNEIIDRVYIRDDGSYSTIEFFTEVTGVKYTGFNGRVTLTIGSDISYTEDPMHIGVDEDNAGPLYYTVENEDYGVLYYYIDRELFGANYRRDGAVLDLEDTEVWAHVIRDSAGAEIEPVDSCFDYNNGYLIVLDIQGYLHWYETGRANFTPLSRLGELTPDSYLEVQALTAWTVLDNELKLFTRFQRPDIAVAGVRIQRKSPTGIVRYLQGDLTWGVGSYWHQQNINPNITDPALTWTDFGFEAELDEVGQWEFYCEVADNVGSVTLTGTAVAVSAVDALKSIDSEVVTVAAETPERLFIGLSGQPCIGTTEGNLYDISLYYLYWYADVSGQTIWATTLLSVDPNDVLDIEVAY